MAAAALRIADQGPRWSEAAAFVAGLPLGGLAITLAFGRPSVTISSSIWTLVIGGLLFGAGLVLSGMTDPALVLGFLDIAGRWDPTLAFVLASALVPSAVAYALRRRMTRPLLADEFRVPTNQAIEPRLIAGAALFGIGWGLVGLCPGPAIAGLVTGRWQVWLFVSAMSAGMALHRILADLPARRPLKLSGETQ